MEPEVVVDALSHLHAALAPGGRLVDSQPVSPRPSVLCEERTLGRLDAREFVALTEAVDRSVEAAIFGGRFALEATRRYVVVEQWDTGAELVESVRDWRGTTISPKLARGVAEAGPVSIPFDVVLRVLRVS